MTKFEKVSEALTEKTRGTENWITLTKNVDGRHTEKYTTRNLITNQTGSISFKNLDEVIKHFELEI